METVSANLPRPVRRPAQTFVLFVNQQGFVVVPSCPLVSAHESSSVVDQAWLSLELALIAAQLGSFSVTSLRRSLVGNSALRLNLCYGALGQG
jgi:hypothetical protein